MPDGGHRRRPREAHLTFERHPAEAPLRLGSASDAAALADLVNVAGEGAPYRLWSSLAGPDDDPWAVGIGRQAQRAEAGEVIVMEDAGVVVAALMGRRVADDPPPVPDDTPPILRPLEELERAVPGTICVNALATFPRARGRGLGSRLLDFAERCARAERLRGVAVICSDGNVGARRLYERLGYRRIGAAPVVRNGWDSPSEEWLLLFKET